MPTPEDESPEVPAFVVYFWFLHRNFQDWLEMFSGKRYNVAAGILKVKKFLGVSISCGAAGADAGKIKNLGVQKEIR